MKPFHDQEPAPHNDNLPVEIVALDGGDSTAPHKSNLDKLARQDERHAVLTYLFPRNKHVRLALITSNLLVGLAVLIALSGTFPFLNASLRALVSRGTTGRSVSTLDQGGPTCALQAVWSPDSRRIAVLGYNQDCLPENPAAALTIYDARTLQLITQVQPEAAILAAYKISHPRQQEAPTVAYGEMLWSPDGTRVALSFDVYVPLSPATVGSVGLFMFENGKQTTFIAPVTGIGSLYSWDIVRGVPVKGHYHFPAQSPLVQYNIAPAPVYRWNNAGLLDPETATGNGDAGLDQLTHPGNPARDASFSIWQPGVLIGMPDLVQGSASSNSWQEMYGWQTFFAAWSPDGRYFTGVVLTGGRLNLGGERVVIDPLMRQIPLLSTSDRTLKLLLQGRTGGFYIPVAWRPDGRVLAAYAAGQVHLYDCLTGKKLAVLTPKGSEALGLAQDAGNMLWSPNGADLLFYSSTWDQVTLWGARQLPKV